MQLDIETDSPDFDPQRYIKILIAVVKADRFNGSSETAYVKNLANRLNLDFVTLWNETDRDMPLDQVKVSRVTALSILKECIKLASLDGNFTLSEKELVYSYAAKLDIPLSEVKLLEKWLEEFNKLAEKWDELIAGYE